MGVHFIIDIYDVVCDEDRAALVNPVEVEKMFSSILKALNLKPASNVMHRQFLNPVGLTSFQILQTSHISLHTYLEHDYAAFDIYTCLDSVGFSEVEHIFQQIFPMSTVFVRGVIRDAETRPALVMSDFIGRFKADYEDSE